jgi:hypothetical protein
VNAPPVADEPEARLSPPPVRSGLHRPWRALVALAELIGAAAAIWGAFACWDRGISTVVLVQSGESVRHHGGWLALAILLGTVAAVLVLDAVRQLVLAIRARPLPPPPKHAVSAPVPS